MIVAQQDLFEVQSLAGCIRFLSLIFNISFSSVESFSLFNVNSFVDGAWVVVAMFHWSSAAVVVIMLERCWSTETEYGTGNGCWNVVVFRFRKILDKKKIKWLFKRQRAYHRTAILTKRVVTVFGFGIVCGKCNQSRLNNMFHLSSRSKSISLAVKMTKNWSYSYQITHA